MKPSEHWLQLVAKTMSNRSCGHVEAWKITADAYPAAAILMSASGRSRQTVRFFNSREAAKVTPQKAKAKKEFYQFVNAKEEAGMYPTAAYNAAARAHPDLVSAMTGAGDVQFLNDVGGDIIPAGSPRHYALFRLPMTTTQEQWEAAYKGNGSIMAPFNPAKVFAALVELAQKKSTSLSYNDAITRCKTDYPDLWDSVELLSKEPV